MSVYPYDIQKLGVFNDDLENNKQTAESLLKFQNWILAALSVIITDVYLFARMFTIFREEGIEPTTRCQESVGDHPQNILVHGGSEHINNIHQLLFDIFRDHHKQTEENSLLHCIENLPPSYM